MNKYNENNKKHGYWEEYWENGKLWDKGNYLNGKRHGYWEQYYPNGKLWYKGNYLNDEEIGFWIEGNKTEFHL